MSIINESYIVGVDMNEDTQESTLVVIKRNGDKLEPINTFIGKEAEMIYKKLTKPNRGIDTSSSGAEVYYEVLRNKWTDTDLLCEESIVDLIGYRGLRALMENRYIANCRISNGRRLYLLCERGN